MALKAPFPYFGGKSKIAPEVWQRFGDVPNYVEPFAGSAAVLLARPDEHRWWERTETLNDADGLLVNVWRAIRHDPEAVARYADEPVFESDLHARHAWLVGKRESLTRRLEGDPDWYDARAAGWWAWGASCWIGRDWCSGAGPWRPIDGELVRDGTRPGIMRQLPQLSSRDGMQGIRAGGPDDPVRTRREIAAWLERLAVRMRAVRIMAGDWSRVVVKGVTTRHGLTGVFLDPPYDPAERSVGIYAVDGMISAEVREWALEHGDDPEFRIALCGYEGEHEMPGTWTAVPWRANGGMGNIGNGRGRSNAAREVVWFSPHCLSGAQAVQQSLLVDA